MAVAPRPAELRAHSRTPGQPVLLRGRLWLQLSWQPLPLPPPQQGQPEVPQLPCLSGSRATPWISRCIARPPESCLSTHPPLAQRGWGLSAGDSRQDSRAQSKSLSAEEAPGVLEKGGGAGAGREQEELGS